MKYKRLKVAGGCYFFTVNLHNRNSTLLIEQIDLLRDVIHLVKSRHPFTIDAMVVLPEHIHAIWTLPPNDFEYAKRWMLIKANFSRQIPKTEPQCQSRIKKRERGIWQRRFWEHLIKNDMDYERHVDYIHYNPVKHGYVQSAIDWEFSSIHKHIKNGTLSRSWGSET